MQVFKYLIVGAVCLALLNPVDAGWFRRTIRKIGRGVKKVVKGVGKVAKKVVCKTVFGLLCPRVPRVPGRIVGVPIGALIDPCHVRSRNCKREAPQEMETMVMVPFSDKFDDYDLNGDKEIVYEEFAFAVMGTLPMADPEELREPFIWADMNGDDKLDMDEFMGAPFSFAHYDADTPEAA